MSEIFINVELQNTWSWAKSKEIGLVINGDRGKNYPSRQHYIASGVPFLSAGNLDEGKIDKSSLNYISEEKYNALNNGKLQKGDIIYCLRGTLGKCAAFDLEGKAAIASSLAILRPSQLINKKYLLYFLQGPFGSKLIKHFDNGTAQPNLSGESFSNYDFPIAPLPEQHRIVAKIEELFSSLDKGIESLKTAQTQLKVYRQSVLKWAFEGKLTGDWRKHNADKIAKSNLLETIYAEKKAAILKAGKKWKEPTKPTETHLEDIPQFASEWEYDFFTNITHNIGDVDHKMPKAKDTGIPYISTKDFDDTDGFSFDKAKRISEDDYNFLARKIFPEFNDILISRYGTVGEIRQVKTQDKFQASYSVAIIKTVKNETLVKYLIYCLQSDILQKQIRKYTRATAQPDLGLEHMRQFIVPFPSLYEQEEIIQEIESRLSVCDKIEESISTSLLQAEALRQSILKKAFEGKLVEQDPNDEPASVLLERIRAEREALRQAQGKNKAVKKARKQKLVNG
jgi:type I restriction enzyme, S subunit